MIDAALRNFERRSEVLLIIGRIHELSISFEAIRDFSDCFSRIDVLVDPMRERRMQSSRLQAEPVARLHRGGAISRIAAAYFDSSVCTT